MIGPNFIFIHINRTGGTSIEYILKEHGGQQVYYKHDTIADIINIKGQDILKDKFSFTVVRNPWDKMVSLYCILKQNAKIQLETFYEWIHNTYDKDNNWKYTSNQLSWLTIDGKPDSKILVDEIYQLENITEAWIHIKDRLGIIDELPQLNSTIHEHYREFYCNETRDIVYDHFKYDIQRFNYKF